MKFLFALSYQRNDQYYENDVGSEYYEKFQGSDCDSEVDPVKNGWMVHI